MSRTAAVLTAILGFTSAVVFGEAEQFKGDVEVDKGKLKAVKKIALADVSGETKHDKAKVQAWTEKSLAATIGHLQKLGYEVVTGAAVKAALQEVAPVPSEDDVFSFLVKKRKMPEQQASQTAKFYYANYAKKEPGDSAEHGYTIFRPEGSVNLDRPLFDLEKGKVDSADRKELQRRISGLREKLGVDAIVMVEFGYGSTKYGEPGWVQARKAAGKPIGLTGGIASLKGLFKGSTANVHINMEFYDKDAKDDILHAQGHCESKDSAGMSLKGDAKVSALLDDTAAPCVDRMFEKIADKM
jgi:hypothetical protein